MNNVICFANIKFTVRINHVKVKSQCDTVWSSESSHNNVMQFWRTTHSSQFGIIYVNIYDNSKLYLRTLKKTKKIEVIVL